MTTQSMKQTSMRLISHIDDNDTALVEKVFLFLTEAIEKAEAEKPKSRPKKLHKEQKKVSWREMTIPDNIRKMSLGKVAGFPTDDKETLETILKEKYESLS